MLELEQDFIKWVHSIQPSLIEFNPGSVQQLQQLLFAPCYRNISPDKIKKHNFRTTTPKQPSSAVDGDQIQEENLDEEQDLNGISRILIIFYKTLAFIREKELNSKNADGKLIQVLPEERIFRVENVYVINLYIYFSLSKNKQSSCCWFCSLVNF